MIGLEQAAGLPRIGGKHNQRKPKMTAAIRAAAMNQMGKVRFAVTQLMARTAVPYNVGNKRAELKPEQLLSLQLADRLRALTAEWDDTGGKYGYRGIWTHVANERKEGWFTMILLRAMGMIGGAFDYWFMWENGGCLVELKAGGDLSWDQEYFETWAHDRKVPHFVRRSVDDVIKVLIDLGAVIENPAPRPPQHF